MIFQNLKLNFGLLNNILFILIRIDLRMIFGQNLKILDTVWRSPDLWCYSYPKLSIPYARSLP